MKNTFFNITNHNLTKEQVKDLEENHQVGEIINLPDDLKQLWGQIPADKDSKELKREIVEPIANWVLQEVKSDAGAIAMVMGEMTVAYSLIKELGEYGVNIVVATSKRESKEVLQEDGSIRKVNIFKHVMFRYLMKMYLLEEI